MTMLTLADPPASDLDPFSHEMLDNPFPMHAELREAGPVVYLTRYDVYALARYEQVHASLVNWQQLESSAGVGLTNLRRTEQFRPPSLLLEADPPRHDAPRRVLGQILTSRSLRRFRESWFSEAEALVADVLSAGPEFDAVTALAQALPMRVFPDAVGIGTEGRENLLPYGDHQFNAFVPTNDLGRNGEERGSALLPWINAQTSRDALAPVGFGADLAAAADRGDITPGMAAALVRTMLSAGIDTTVGGICAVLCAFATHPDQWQRLREDPSLARIAFDEAVRWQSPLQTFFRTAAVDVRIGDVAVPEGAKVLMFLASANRDPRRWDDPDQFDLSRDPSGHVGFGMGIHQCVGQHVARLEAEALLLALARRIRRFDLTGPVKQHHNNTLRAWESIPLRVTLD
jgi:4-methoxybenzoate monooxygenase (O-demethylating)